jgi:hypothetical protein
MSARGLAGGNQGVAAEVLNSYTLGNQRYQQSLANAQNAYNLGASQFSGAMGIYGNQLLGQSQAYTPANIYGTAYNMSQGLGAQIFQPESQYNAGLITANRKEAMDVQIANQQAANARMNGIISAVGQVGSAFATGGLSSFGGAAGGTAIGGSIGSLGAGGAASGINYNNYSNIA